MNQDTASLKKTAIIEFDRVSFRYRSSNVTAVENVTLEVFPLDFIGIVGPNGGGKTTLLNLMLGLIKPSDGAIRVLNHTPKKTCTHLGFVPQFSVFRKNIPMNTEDMVLMGKIKRQQRFNIHKKSDSLQARSTMERLGIQHLVGRQIASLSGGELQRALIARAIISNPKALLLDEPTASVDSEGERDIQALLKELNKTMAIVLVSHDVSYISSHVQRTFYVNKSVDILVTSQGHC